MAEPAHTNRLIHEASPYLLQHAHNPVDWWAWGSEAFAEARRRDVPVFLSIGYSTCYWCHVMERESFENEEIARLMNAGFVCVKVDREQRPDVDEIYMAATQIMTGHGGWPMNVFLEPRGLRPFYCGTYWPSEMRAGMGSMPTFPRVLEVMGTLWREQRGQVMQQAEDLETAVREHVAGQAGPVALGVEVVQAAAGGLLRMFDRTNGGFGGAPKFPQPVYLDLLLDIRERAGDEGTKAALDEAIRHTLDRMAVGGMRDQVGGGFHRYSVDAHWTVPHFEKMLYDNAMLAEVFARAGAMYGGAWYREVARTTVEYVLREMTLRDEQGRAIAFYTAQDAEVDHREGLNYLWTAEQVRAALPGEDAEFAIRVYGLDRGANFRDPHHPQEPASNVLRMDLPPAEMAARMGMGEGEFEARLARVNGVLYAVRGERKQPALDDKTVLSWNGLMVRALAVVGMLEERIQHGGTEAPRKAGEEDRGGRRGGLVEVAEGVARSLLERMRGQHGGLMRVMRGGRVQTGAMLEDYAAMVRGLMTLARMGATGESASPSVVSQGLADTSPARGGGGAWALSEARRLIGDAERVFGDGRGGFFDTREGDGELFVRGRASYDGAMPAGTTLMALGLAELAVWTREDGDVDRAVEAIRAISAAIAENPVGSAVGTRALLTMLKDPGLVGGRLGYDATGRRVGDGGAQGGSAPGFDPEDSAASSILDGFTPVEVFAPDERVALKPGVPAELRLMIRIAPGYHVVAADPGNGAAGLGLAPFRVDVVDAGAAGGGRGGARGAIAAYADYPVGAEFRPSAVAAPMRVYEGEFELLVVLERGEGAVGRPLLVVTFQACTERECLKVMRLELDVAIDG